MSQQQAVAPRTSVPPPSKHQLAFMIWLAVVPTLVVLNLALSSALSGLPVVAKTFIVATIAVPIVIYGLMPQLHGIRGRLLRTRGKGAGSLHPRGALGKKGQ